MCVPLECAHLHMFCISMQAAQENPSLFDPIALGLVRLSPCSSYHLQGRAAGVYIFDVPMFVYFNISLLLCRHPPCGSGSMQE